MDAHQPTMTAEQLIRMSSPGKRFELWKGELIVMVPAGARHGWISMRIGNFLTNHVDANGLGRVFGSETGFRLERGPDTVLAPDVSYVAAARLPAGDLPAEYLELAPDLVVEVLSPSDRAGEVESKARAWLAYSAGVVWVVSPEARSVTVYHLQGAPRVLGESDAIDGSPVLATFRRSVRDFFS